MKNTSIGPKNGLATALPRDRQGAMGGSRQAVRPEKARICGRCGNSGKDGSWSKGAKKPDAIRGGAARKQAQAAGVKKGASGALVAVVGKNGVRSACA